MKRAFVANQICHVYNRGVDKRIIFLEDGDYLRCIHDIFEFNDTKPAFNFGRSHRRPSPVNNVIDFRNQSIDGGQPRLPRKRVVDILAFCLMPNHFHFLLRSLVVGGITLLTRKLGAGYANYFNQKYERSGALFQGGYKAVAVTKEPHFLYLPYYIHLNPLDLFAPGWKEQGIVSVEKALDFLRSYRWSSYPDYIGIKNFPSLTQREFLNEIFGGAAQHEQETERLILEFSKTAERFDLLGKLTLE